jgi:hypothetical protein
VPTLAPMPDRLEPSGLNRAWIDAAAALPLDWRIEGVVCTSTGLRPEERSDRWRAWAARPNGEKIEAEAGGPEGALHALARELRPLRGAASG